jgi:peptidoglycan/LPS O-acetylase OafA/YrhL
MGIVWTLEIELAFYAFCILIRRQMISCNPPIFGWQLLALPFSYVAGSLMAVTLGWSRPIFSLLHWSSSVMQFITFMLVGTAFHFHFRGKMDLMRMLIIQTVLLVAFIGCWRFGMIAHDGWAGPISYLIAYFAFSAAYYGRRWFLIAPPPVRRWSSRLADISYPLYAVHGILGYTLLARMLAAGVPPGVALLCAIALVVALATIVHLSVEIPSRNAGKSLARRLSA